MAAEEKRIALRRFVGPKRTTALIALIGFYVLARYLRQQGLLTPEIFQDYLGTYPVKSAVVFTLIYAVSVIATLPTLPLNLAAGYFWGGLAGGLVATGGSALGAVCAFLVARAMFGQPLARRFEHPRVSWVQNEFEQNGWRFIAFVRLNPVFPTGVLNYLFGLTSVRLRTYSWASIAFLFPPSLVFAIIGDHTGTFLLDDGGTDVVRTILFLSLALTLLLALRFFSRIFTRTRKLQ